jgi:phage baseplate assembly protein W
MTMPFSIDTFGRVAFTEDRTRIWADRARMVAGTSVGERVMRPTWGTDLVEAFFTSGEVEEEAVEAALETAFAEFLPDITVTEVQSTRDKYEPSRLYVDLTYTIPGRDEPITADVSLVSPTDLEA